MLEGGRPFPLNNVVHITLSLRQTRLVILLAFIMDTHPVPNADSAILAIIERKNMENDGEQRTMIGKFGNGNKGLYWTVGGMFGGLVVGITLANIYGWTLLSASFWLGFGLIVGAISGGISYMLYRVIYSAVVTKHND